MVSFSQRHCNPSSEQAQSSAPANVAQHASVLWHRGKALPSLLTWKQCCQQELLSEVSTIVSEEDSIGHTYLENKALSSKGEPHSEP